MLKKIITSLVISLVTFIFVNFFSTHTKLFLRIERGISDALFYFREPGMNDTNPFVSEKVKLIGYDDDSITIIGKWPWKRNVYAEFLNKIEKFSPEAVMFDLFFEKPESIPDYVRNKLNSDPSALQKVEDAFIKMDQEFSDSLAKHDNVYLDLLLLEQQRFDLPKDFMDRLKFNEQVILKHSQLAADNVSPVSFYSMEPILIDYIKSAHPVAVNALPDNDGVVRSFPIYCTYHMSDGTKRNVYSVILSMLIKYYHITDENILIKSDKVILKKAKVPVINPETRQPIMLIKDFTQISQRITNQEQPKEYRYNQNLFNLLINQNLLRKSDENNMPNFPIHLIERPDNSLEIIDNWEVYHAAKQINSKKVITIIYNEKDIEIDTPFGSFFYINYAGREKSFYIDSKTGDIKSYTPIPTGGFKDVYTIIDPPDIPKTDNKGNIAADYDTKALETWFYNFCKNRSETVYREVNKKFPKADDQRIIDYINQNPDNGKYYFYNMFFKQNNIKADMLEESIADYPAFAEKLGQTKEYYLNEKQMLVTLLDFYREQFEKYLNTFIFTGGTATGLGDIQHTPYSNMFGINVIINAYNTIITQNQLIMSKDIKGLDLSMLICFCLILGLTYGLINIRISGYLFIVIFISTLISSFAIFEYNNFILRTTPLIFANILLFGTTILFKLMTEEKEKKFLRSTFSAYVAPELIEDMYKTKTHPKLGGEAKIITAFFTDIQGFSSFSEKLTAEQLVELLNEYLSAMTDILLEDEGTLDKYEGDAIVAFFGAPMDLPDHAFKACRSALSMQKKLGELRDKWRNEKKNPNEPDRNTKNLQPYEWGRDDKWPRIVHDMRVRVGINTGEIVVGNMGSSVRMNYTMMGDPVNLAARLEAAAKQYGLYLLISEYTREQEFIDAHGIMTKVKDMIDTRLIDYITVVGKSQPVRIYEPLALKGEMTQKEKILCDLFHEGIRYYWKMNWDKAIELFTKALSVEPFPDNKINPSKLYIQRCKTFKENPPVKPGEKWDGVFKLTKK